MRLLLGVEPLADRSGSGRLVWADDPDAWRWLFEKHLVVWGVVFRRLADFGGDE